MKILVDTSVWSLALRKKKYPSKMEAAVITTLADLILDLRVIIIGPIRQEILSGITNRTRFEEITEKMNAFIDVPLTTEDYVNAAIHSNASRYYGIQGSDINFLICALSLRMHVPIFTLDRDFGRYKKYLPITLFTIT